MTRIMLALAVWLAMAAVAFGGESLETAKWHCGQGIEAACRQAGRLLRRAEHLARRQIAQCIAAGHYRPGDCKRRHVYERYSGNYTPYSHRRPRTIVVERHIPVREVPPPVPVTNPPPPPPLAVRVVPDHRVISGPLDRGPDCIVPVSAVGTEHQTLEDARDAAIKAWRARVRHDSGARYMDEKHAKDKVFECTRSSPGTRFADKASEAAGGRHVIECKFTAIACRPPQVDASTNN